MPSFEDARAVIADLSQLPNPEAIHRTEAVRLGGVPQFVSVRGRDAANPVLLVVHGGPAGPLIPTNWIWQRGVEEYFTVVNYDQRAAGKTSALSDLAGQDKQLTLQRYVDDAVELIAWIAEELGVAKVALLGHSWGTVIALTLLQQHPELCHCYIGVGQVTSGLANEQLSFGYGKQAARSDGNEAALAEMAAIEPYPGDTPPDLPRVIVARKWAQHYGGLSAYRTESNYYFGAPLLSPDYEEADRATVDIGSAFTVPRVMSELMAFDVTTFSRTRVPVIQFLGRHDWTTPTAPTIAWLERLDAPAKQAVWFEHSAHMCMFEEPGKFLLSLVEHALPHCRG